MDHASNEEEEGGLTNSNRRNDLVAQIQSLIGGGEQSLLVDVELLRNQGRNRGDENEHGQSCDRGQSDDLEKEEDRNLRSSSVAVERRRRRTYDDSE